MQSAYTKNCYFVEVPSLGEQLPEPHYCNKRGGDIGSHTEDCTTDDCDGAGQFLSLQRIYALRLTTLNLTLCHMPSQPEN